MQEGISELNYRASTVREIYFLFSFISTTEKLV